MGDPGPGGHAQSVGPPHVPPAYPEGDPDPPPQGKSQKDQIPQPPPPQGPEEAVKEPQRQSRQHRRQCGGDFLLVGRIRKLSLLVGVGEEAALHQNARMGDVLHEIDPRCRFACPPAPRCQDGGQSLLGGLRQVLSPIGKKYLGAGIPGIRKMVLVDAHHHRRRQSVDLLHPIAQVRLLFLADGLPFRGHGVRTGPGHDGVAAQEGQHSLQPLCNGQIDLVLPDAGNAHRAAVRGSVARVDDDDRADRQRLHGSRHLHAVAQKPRRAQKKRRHIQIHPGVPFEKFSRFHVSPPCPYRILCAMGRRYEPFLLPGHRMVRSNGFHQWKQEE